LLDDYHDTEWGVPVHDDQKLFEHIILDGAHAGLSWLTILKKREAYRKAFDNFEIERVARFTPAKVEKLLANPGIVRNRLKIASAVKNARATLPVQAALQPAAAGSGTAAARARAALVRAAAPAPVRCFTSSC
jgi:DNA-3-methyladenine glycosylase I